MHPDRPRRERGGEQLRPALPQDQRQRVAAFVPFLAPGGELRIKRKIFNLIGRLRRFCNRFVMRLSHGTRDRHHGLARKFLPHPCQGRSRCG
jgi:hypothetical protein